MAQRRIWLATFTATLALLVSASGAVAGDALAAEPPVLLQMIRDDAVHAELALSAEQQNQVIEALRLVDGRWFRSRILPADKQGRAIQELTSQLRGRLGEVLDERQTTRLHQLERQALGTRMFLRGDVAAQLDLKPSQQDALRAAFDNTDSKSRELQQQLRNGDLNSQSASAELNRLQAKERDTVMGILTRQQQARIGSLTGDLFDFSTVRRTYPLAPEFEASGATWIQGGPLTLQQLRGKVVAIHFYAFQCINCQRNFPHYQAWHQDYADQGLVVVGIQTPETATERKLEHVAAAAKKDGMAYPIIMDGESSNWNTWSNTMWPTVYLIDKEGFIRRWWQGELNWKETKGEQQMRRTIEQLLAEDR